MIDPLYYISKDPTVGIGMSFGAIIDKSKDVNKYVLIKNVKNII